MSESKFCSSCGAGLQNGESSVESSEIKGEVDSIPPPPPSFEHAEETVQSEVANPVDRTTENQLGDPQVESKKRRSVGGRILRTLIILAILVGGGWFAFEEFAPPEVRREFYESTGLENSSFVTESAMASYVEVVDVFSRQKLLENAWIVTGSLRNKHSSKSISTVELEFVFTDGSEFQTFNKIVNPESFAASVFRRKISGHKRGDLLRVRVVEAY
jgi:hypothetical protein